MRQECDRNAGAKEEGRREEERRETDTETKTGEKIARERERESAYKSICITMEWRDKRTMGQ